MKLFIVVGVILHVAAIFAEEVRLLDLAPNDAQSILDKQDLSLNYAPKIDSNVPALRYLGKELHEVLEDVYQARQFHGQDGIGGYVYGYAVPDIAKAEKKNPSGDLKGSYSYINGDGQEIKVDYWDDGTGFHHVDNLPKIVLEANTDTPEVQAAKDEHFRIWRELAVQNKAAGISYEAPEDTRNYDDSAKYNYDESKDQARYERPTPIEEQEPVKDPKGFFYSFDYPVGIIVDKGRAVSGGVQKRSNEGTPVDTYEAQNELYNKNRSILNGGLKASQDSRLSLKATNFGAIPIAAVHDAQVPSYLKDKIMNTQTYPLYFHE